MFFAKRYKLQGRGQALVMTMPIAIVRAFNLSSDSRLNVSYSYQDQKLVIDLEPPPAMGRPREAHATARQEVVA